MSFLLDTNIAIHIRDKSIAVMDRLEARDIVPKFSIVSRVELEGGVDREPPLAIVRRMRLHAMVASFQWLPFQHDAAAEYGRLITNLGFSRTRILDRMIAAQAIVLDATLVTMNGPDFNDIPGLKLEIWPSPEAAD